jgi:hypothetical protein
VERGAMSASSRRDAGPVRPPPPRHAPPRRAVCVRMIDAVNQAKRAPKDQRLTISHCVGPFPLTAAGCFWAPRIADNTCTQHIAA